jgi:hypothetical protein
MAILSSPSRGDYEKIPILDGPDSGLQVSSNAQTPVIPRRLGEWLKATRSGSFRPGDFVEAPFGGN